MNPLQVIEQTPCNVKYLQHDMCQVTFTIHQQDIQAFQLMFSSFATLFKNLAWKAKTNIHVIHQRIQENQSRTQTFIEEYENSVCCSFKDLCQENEPRVAFSLLVSSIKEDYPNSSYDQCKQILTKHKLLKKTGFYKTRTH